MKTLFKLSLLTLTTTLFLGACKKSENDPFSLSSRKARICGEWKVTKDDYTSTNVNTSNSTTSTSTSTYNGSTEYYTYTSGSFTSQSTNIYTTDVEINKDGTFLFTRTDADGVSKSSGNWSFLGKSKSADLKNKEAIILYFTDEEQTGFGDIESYSTGNPTGENAYTLIIDKLSKKEIVFKSENKSTGSNYTGTYSSTIVWTAK
jgi:hypothetical protein